MGQQVAFIGLGVMGFPMAGYLAAKGHNVAVYNRTAERAKAWTERHGGRKADTPADAAKGAEAVFLCVGNDDDVRSAPSEDSSHGGRHSNAAGSCREVAYELSIR